MRPQQARAEAFLLPIFLVCLVTELSADARVSPLTQHNDRAGLLGGGLARSVIRLTRSTVPYPATSHTHKPVQKRNPCKAVVR